jgi:hypothetical protein
MSNSDFVKIIVGFTVGMAVTWLAIMGGFKIVQNSHSPLPAALRAYEQCLYSSNGNAGTQCKYADKVQP